MTLPLTRAEPCYAPNYSPSSDSPSALSLAGSSQGATLPAHTEKLNCRVYEQEQERRERVKLFGVSKTNKRERESATKSDETDRVSLE